MDSCCESRWKKMIGKSRLGGRKLNVRFDEGELEIEPMLLRQLSTLPFSLFQGLRMSITYLLKIPKNT
jgi:hypothetical protein